MQVQQSTFRLLHFSSNETHEHYLFVYCSELATPLTNQHMLAQRLVTIRRRNPTTSKKARSFIVTGRLQLSAASLTQGHLQGDPGAGCRRSFRVSFCQSAWKKKTNIELNKHRNAEFRNAGVPRCTALPPTGVDLQRAVVLHVGE